MKWQRCVLASVLGAISVAAFLGVAARAEAFTSQQIVGKPGPWLQTNDVNTCSGHLLSDGRVTRSVYPYYMSVGASAAGGFPQTVTMYAHLYYITPGTSVWHVVDLPPVRQTIGWSGGVAMLGSTQPGFFLPNTFVTVNSQYVWRSASGAFLGSVTDTFYDPQDYSAPWGGIVPVRLATLNLNGSTYSGCYFG